MRVMMNARRRRYRIFLSTHCRFRFCEAAQGAWSVTDLAIQPARLGQGARVGLDDCAGHGHRASPLAFLSRALCPVTDPVGVRNREQTQLRNS